MEMNLILDKADGTYFSIYNGQKKGYTRRDITEKDYLDIIYKRKTIEEIYNSYKANRYCLDRDTCLILKCKFCDKEKMNFCKIDE